jgi:hypothetical protein
MFSKPFSSLVLPALLLLSFTEATQVDKRSVGALTPLSSKIKACNILDYGGVADNSTDIGPAIISAFSECAINGGATIYIPPGSYSRKIAIPIQSWRELITSCSPNRSYPEQGIGICPSNRWTDHPHLGRQFWRERHRDRERIRR